MVKKPFSLNPLKLKELVGAVKGKAPYKVWMLIYLFFLQIYYRTARIMGFQPFIYKWFFNGKKEKEEKESEKVKQEQGKVNATLILFNLNEEVYVCFRKH